MRDLGDARPLHLVDSFDGMPRTTDGIDRLQEGDLGSTSAEEVRGVLAPFPLARVHEGFIPAILAGIDPESIAWAHIDVNIYAAVRDSLEWVYPRLTAGGTIIARRLRLPELPRRSAGRGRVLRHAGPRPRSACRRVSASS